jgi:tetratricopeptide (TPR) repeat protein
LRAQADADGIAYSALELAQVTHDLGQREEAWALVEESIHLCANLGDDYTLALALFHQAYQLGQSRKIDEALALLYRVREIQRQLGDEVDLSDTLNSLAVEIGQDGRDEEAEVLFREGLVLKQRLKLRTGIVKVLGNLANWEIRHNRIEAARGYAEAALQMARETAHPGDLIRALMRFAELAVVTHQLDEAERLQEEVRQLGVHGKSSVALRAFLVSTTGHIRLARGDWDGAKAAFIELLNFKTDPEAILYLGFAIAATGQPERGLELTALAMNHPGSSKPALKHPDIKPHLAAMKSQLTEEAHAAAWERGQALDFEATVAELFAEFGGDPPLA